VSMLQEQLSFIRQSRSNSPKSSLNSVESMSPSLNALSPPSGKRGSSLPGSPPLVSSARMHSKVAPSPTSHRQQSRNEGLEANPEFSRPVRKDSAVEPQSLTAWEAGLALSAQPVNLESKLDAVARIRPERTDRKRPTAPMSTLLLPSAVSGTIEPLCLPFSADIPS
jgi:hypothetical protein